MEGWSGECVQYVYASLGRHFFCDFDRRRAVWLWRYRGGRRRDRQGPVFYLPSDLRGVPYSGTVRRQQTSILVHLTYHAEFR
jgi:hypothetical protein